MDLVLKRRYLKDSYTIGHLYIDGQWFCDTLEDKVRPEGTAKVYGETAIPYGKYKVTLDVRSPKFSKREFYKESCGGFLPRLMNVPNFEGILIHVADGCRGADLLEGCIGVGYNLIKGGLLLGRSAFTKLYSKLKEADNKNEEIWITIE